MTASEQPSMLPDPPPVPPAPLAAPPPPPPPPASGPVGPSVAAQTYKPVAGLGRVLQGLMVGWALLGGLAAGSTLRFRNALSDLEANPLAVTPEDLLRLEDITDVFAILQIIVFCVIALIFVIWFRRMHVNLRAFGEERTAYSDGWAVGGWLIPIVNFFRPKEIADDIWRRSNPERSREAGYQGMPTGRIPALVHWWWGIYIVAGISAWGARTGGSIESVSGATTRATWWFIGDLLQVVLGLVTFLVVAMFTDRQGRRAAFFASQADAAAPAPAPIVPVGFDVMVDAPVAPPVVEDDVPHEPQIPEPADWKPRLAAMAGAAVLAIAAIPIAVALIDEPQDSQDFAGTPTIVFDLERGDCFNFPESIDRADYATAQAIMAVDVVDCDEPHTGEMVAEARWSGFASVYPGDESLLLEGTDLCLPHLQDYVGANFLEAGLDIFVVVPDRARWASGSRVIACMATNLDSDATLSWSLRGAGTALPEDRRTLWSLEVGECFDEPTDQLALVMDLVPCGVPHDYETFAVLTHPTEPGGPFPGENEMWAWAEDECASAYGGVIDKDKSANLDFGFGGIPVAQTWAEGHRTVTCVLWNQVGQLTESVLVD